MIVRHYDQVILAELAGVIQRAKHPADQFCRALESLRKLGLIDKKGDPTAKGQEILAERGR